MRKMKVFNVFLSSSFQDMHVERDYLRKNVFRKLEAELMAKGARLRVMDLRGSEIGSKGELSEEEAVFLMCLHGVDACRPRLIGLLGDRYGWVPYGDTAKYKDEKNRNRIHTAVENIHNNILMPINKEEMKDKSITHIEIYYGLKERDDSIDNSRAGLIACRDSFFYFRNINTGNGALPAFYKDGQELQNKLKSWIRDKMGEDYKEHINEYEAEWDNENGNIKEESLNQLGNLVYNQLRSNILQELAEISREEDTEEETAIYLAAKSENTVIRNETKELVKFASGDGEGQILLVTGPAGCGKSTLLAQAYEQLIEDSSENIFVITHAAGLDSKASTVTGLMKHYCIQIERELGLPSRDFVHEAVNENLDLGAIQLARNERKQLFDQLRERLSELIFLASSERKLIILLDSADSLENSENSRGLKWLPEKLSKNLRIIVSSLPDFVDMDTKYNLKSLFLGGMPIEQIRKMMTEMAFSLYGKGWNSEVLDRASEKAARVGGYPLYAQILVSHLMNMSLKDFLRFPTDKSHILWMNDEINDAPQSIDDLYSLCIKRAREDYGRDVADAVLGVISSTRHGIGEGDLRGAVYEITGKRLSDVELLSLRGLFTGHLRQDLQQEWWDFEHQQFRRCIASMNTIPEKKFRFSVEELNNGIAGAADSSSETAKYMGFFSTEYIWHCYCGNNIEKAVEWYLNMPEEIEADAVDTIRDILNSSGDGEKEIKWIGDVLEKELKVCDESDREAAFFSILLYNFVNQVKPDYSTSRHFKLLEMFKACFERHFKDMDSEGGVNPLALGATIDMSISMYYLFLGEYQKGLEYLLGNEKKLQPLKDVEGIDYIYNTVVALIAQIYSREGKGEAKKWLSLAEEMSNKKTGDSKCDFIDRIIKIFSDYGIYSVKNDTLEMKKVLNQFEEIIMGTPSDKFKEFENIAYGMCECLNGYTIIDEYDKLSFLGGRVLKILEQIWDMDTGINASLLSTGRYYMVMAKYYEYTKDMEKSKENLLISEAALSKFTKRNSDDMSALNWYASVCSAMGEILYSEGSFREAKCWYARADEILSRSLKIVTDIDAFNYYYDMISHTAELYTEDGEEHKAQSLYANFMEICKKIIEMKKGNTSLFIDYAHACLYLSNIYFKNKDTERLNLMRSEVQSLNLEDHIKKSENLFCHYEYFRICHFSGNLYFGEGDYDNARICYKKGEEQILSLYRQYEDNYEYGDGYFTICSELGKLGDQTGNKREAEEWFLKAAETSKRLHNAQPENLQFMYNYGTICLNLGNLYRELVDLISTEKWYRMAVELREKLCELVPDNNQLKRDYARSCYLLASLLLQYAQREEKKDPDFNGSVDLRLEAVDLLEKRRNTGIQETADSKEIISVLTGLAGIYERRMEFQEAENAFNKIMTLYREKDQAEMSLEDYERAALIFARYAKLLERLNRQEEAKVHWKTAKIYLDHRKEKEKDSKYEG